jgi:hypothetical protein
LISVRHDGASCWAPSGVRHARHYWMKAFNRLTTR